MQCTFKQLKKTGQVEDKRSVRPKKTDKTDEQYLKVMPLKNAKKSRT